jgi:hypothetical protein
MNLPAASGGVLNSTANKKALPNAVGKGFLTFDGPFGGRA